MWDLQTAVQAVAVGAGVAVHLGRLQGGGGLAFGAAAGTRHRRHLRRDRLLWGGAVELLGADGDGVGDGGVVCRSLVVRGPQ